MSNKKQITIKEWLKDVYYDQFGQYIWSKQDADGGSQMIGEVRGWGALQHEFETEDDAALFQDEVGKFIAQAINEKIENTFTKVPTFIKSNAEIMYSEEDMQEYSEFCIRLFMDGTPCIIAKDWFEQFKKK